MPITESAPRRQFGRRLAQLRRARQITGRALAAQLGIKQPALSKIENGKLIPSRDLLERLSAALHLTWAEHADLLGIADTMLRPLHRVELAHEQGHARIQKLVAALEFETLRNFRLSLVPGPLQIEPYVRSLFLPRGVHASQDKEAAIALRLEQARRLDDPTCRFQFLLHESALRARVAPPTVMAEQLTWILEATQLPRVEIRLLPQSLDYHSLGIEPPQSSFDLFDRALLAVDLNGCWLNIDDRATVDLYASYFAGLWQSAHVGDECRRGLRQIRHTHERATR